MSQSRYGRSAKLGGTMLFLLLAVPLRSDARQSVAAAFDLLNNFQYSIKLPFPINVPADYLIVPDGNRVNRVLLVSPRDFANLERTGFGNFQNQDGYFVLGMSGSVAYKNGKFSGEENIQEKMPEARISRKNLEGFDSIAIERTMPGKNPWILRRLYVAMNYNTFVWEACYVGSSEMAIIDEANWSVFLSSFGTRSRLPAGKLEIRKLVPNFGDDPIFWEDIALLDHDASFAPESFKEPALQESEEKILKTIQGRPSRRYTFRKPATIKIEGSEKTETFDRYYSFQHFRSETTRTPEYVSHVTRERHVLDFYFLRSKLVLFVYDHSIQGKGREWIQGPNSRNFVPLPQSNQDSWKFGMMEIVYRYVKQRNSAFRRHHRILVGFGDLLSDAEDHLEINVEDPELQEIPREIKRFKNLKTLSVGSQSLRALPVEIGELAALEYLELAAPLPALPDSFGRLQRLKKLSFHDVKFDEFPRALLELKNLEELKVVGANIQNFPEEIRKLAKLERLEFTSNGLRTVPPQIRLLKNLKYLHLEKNDISEIPEWLMQMPKLERIWLNSNKIRNVPDSLCKKGLFFVLEAKDNPLALSEIKKIEACAPNALWH
ncbi:MAG: leucine-rich repeat domain-containing protein [Spirochaetia bacterium]|nr:leucine-rich repeat domain-containing protein [Spirochaetia bacterium]